MFETKTLAENSRNEFVGQQQWRIERNTKRKSYKNIHDSSMNEEILATTVKKIYLSLKQCT